MDYIVFYLIIDYNLNMYATKGVKAVSDKLTEHFCEYSAIFKMVNFAVNNINGSINTENLDWNFIFTESCKLSLITLVNKGIQLLPKAQQPSQQIVRLFANENRHQIIVDTNQLVELEKLENAFEKNNIDMLLLKGSYLKFMYPATYYRYMGDIDTFVRLEDFERAHSVLAKLSYKMDSDGGKDRIYIKDPYIFLEQHHNLVEQDLTKVNKYFENIWQRSGLKKGYSHIYLMTPEDIYIHLISHAVHHFYYAGIAPRIFLDFYVFLEKNKEKLNMQYVHSVLQDFGYLQFSKKVVELSYRWFSENGSGISKDNKLDLFVASCGNFGQIEHNVGIRSANMTANGKNPSKVKFILKQIFPPFNRIASVFPVLKKLPVLLPVLWVAYIFIKIKKTPTLHYYKNINSYNVDFYKHIIEDMGLN